MNDHILMEGLDVQELNAKPMTGCPRPDRKERIWVVGFAVVVLLVTLLPYLIGYAVQGSDWRFTGFIIGVEDGNSYIAKMLSSSAGAWLFRTPYTAYPQRGVLTYIPYFLLGKLAAPPGLHDQLVALFQIFRIVAVFLSFLATYDFIAFFVEKVSLRRFGLALAVVGGGLGWLLLLVGKGSLYGSMPLEFYSPESFGFLGLFGLPHLAAGRALMLWGLLAYLRTAYQPLDPKAMIWPGMKVGLLWLATGLVQPLAGMLLGVVVGVYILGISCWQLWIKIKFNQPVLWMEVRNRLLLAFWSGLITLPWIIYNLLSLKLDPFLMRWTAQNILPSPHPIHYLLAYLLLVFPAILGAKYIISTRPWNGWLPVAWIISLPFLAYAPTSIQRRLPDGIWVALVVLAMAGLEYLDQKKENQLTIRWFKVSLLLAFPSTIILIFGAFQAVRDPGIPVFRPNDQVVAFNRLAEIAETNQVGLAAYETGNAMPAWAPVRVLIGHGPESINLAELKPRVAQFYQVDTSENTRQELLDEFKVSYVFWGPAERALGSWDPHQASYLEPVYQSDQYVIFSVH